MSAADTARAAAFAHWPGHPNYDSEPTEVTIDGVTVHFDWHAEYRIDGAHHTDVIRAWVDGEQHRHGYPHQVEEGSTIYGWDYTHGDRVYEMVRLHGDQRQWERWVDTLIAGAARDDVPRAAEALVEARERAEQAGMALSASVQRALRYGVPATELAEALGVTRSRVYQLRDGKR